MPRPVFSNSARFSVYKGASRNTKTVDVSNIKTVTEKLVDSINLFIILIILLLHFIILVFVVLDLKF